MSDTIGVKKDGKGKVTVLTNSEISTINGQKYVVHRYADGKGPDLQEAREIERNSPRMKMLTITEIGEMRKSNKLNEFKMLLKPGDFTYICDPGSEKMSLASFLLYDRESRLLDTYVDSSPNYASPVMILKESYNEVDAQQIANTLRVD